MISLPDLPDEVLYQILSWFVAPDGLELQSFWSRGITSHTLLPPNLDNKKYKELGQDQIQAAKQLCLVSRRLRRVFVPLIWSRFQCGSETALKHLRNACNEARVAAHIRHMDIRLSFSKPTQPPSFVSAQLEAIWPHLTSLSSLTLILTSASSCPEWLVKLLEATPTLQTLRLCVFGSSFGPYLRALPQLQNLYLEIHPPDTEGNLTQWIASDEPIHVQRAFYHNWTDLFNDVSEFIDLNTTKGNLRQITWFIYWTMVHSFYSHMTRRNAEPSNVKYINPSNLKSLSRLALTLESQMGTRPFLDAVQGLPLTDLAFTSYGLSLLNGTAFREFCNTFPQLRRLRIKLKTPSHTIGDHAGSIPEGSVNEEEFVKGLASLEHLEAYRGPVLFQRQRSMEVFRSAHAQGNEAVVKLKRHLQVAGVNPSAMFQWHVWLDGAYGPKEYMTLPPEGPEVLGVNVDS